MHLLPFEIHDEILRHLDRQDVASYRLVCRKFADTGAPRLFERLHFRTSLESLQRLALISKRECGRFVKHLLWNTTGSEFEARPFLEGLRMRELKHVLGETTSNIPLSAAEMPSTVVEEQQNGSYQLSSSLAVFLLSAIFSGLPALKGLYVITSGTQPNAFADDGWSQRTSQHSLLDSWPKPWKATHGCPRCHGLCQAIQSSGRYETQVGLLAAHNAGRTLTHLRIENLAFWAAKTGAPMKGYEIALQHVTNLQLVVSAPNRALDEVKRIFQSAPHLRVLKLWLHSSSWWEGVDHSYAVLRLQDIFPSAGSFPYLRELEVHQMDVAQEFMENFLLAHTHSLRTLKMHRMRLDPRGSWPALFARVRGRLGALEAVWLHGQFEEGIAENGWDMDAPHGRRLEGHLLGREAQCPIGEENRSCRW